MELIPFWERSIRCNGIDNQIGSIVVRKLKEILSEIKFSKSRKSRAVRERRRFCDRSRWWSRYKWDQNGRTEREVNELARKERFFRLTKWSKRWSERIRKHPIRSIRNETTSSADEERFVDGRLSSMNDVCRQRSFSSLRYSHGMDETSSLVLAWTATTRSRSNMVHWSCHTRSFRGCYRMKRNAIFFLLATKSSLLTCSTNILSGLTHCSMFTHTHILELLCFSSCVVGEWMQDHRWKM